MGLIRWYMQLYHLLAPISLHMLFSFIYNFVYYIASHTSCGIIQATRVLLYFKNLLIKDSSTSCGWNGTKQYFWRKKQLLLELTVDWKIWMKRDAEKFPLLHYCQYCKDWRNEMNIYFSINKNMHKQNTLTISKSHEQVLVNCIFKAINLPRLKEKT